MRPCSTRRSCRRYTDIPLSMENLAMLLWASQGISGRAGSFFFRTAPSAGALYPVETYLSIQNVESLPPGLYHFQPADFGLERISDGFAGKRVAEAALGQNFMAKAGVVFVWSAILRRNFSKYGHRGLRYVMMDAGHICQNLLLAAEGLALGACPVAAFYDDQLNSLLGLDGEEESVVYLAAVGRKRITKCSLERSHGICGVQRMFIIFQTVPGSWQPIWARPLSASFRK